MLWDGVVYWESINIRTDACASGRKHTGRRVGGRVIVAGALHGGRRCSNQLCSDSGEEGVGARTGKGEKRRRVEVVVVGNCWSL